MNYNNWNGRRSSRGRGRNRNKWNWRGRSYSRMPMLDPSMHNAHPGYNPGYQMHHENRGFYNYKSFHSPSHRKISPPPKPPSPLPGTEEYTQRNIQHASDLIKRQLNIDSDTCSASDANINITNEQSGDKTKDDKAVESDKSNNACPATVTSTATRNTQEPKKSTSSQQSSKQKAMSKPSECINVQEIYTQIVQHISNLSHSKKINLVNQSTDGYDIAIQQVQKQKRLELSRALRDMSKRQTQNSNDGEVINAIIPDIGIKIEDLPKEVIADLSRTLHIELEDRVEQASNLVDPELCFKQAEAILSVNFENTMDDQGDNFGFQGIANTFNYDYLNKPLSPPEFAYNQLEDADKFGTPSTSFNPLPTGLNPDEVKMEESEPDDFTADIDFCIKNLDVHKSYLTCFSSPKQLEARNALFESSDVGFKLPQIKVRTDLLTQSLVEGEAIVENQNLLTGPLQPPNSSDTPQLPTCPIHPRGIDSDLQLDSSSNVALPQLPTCPIHPRGIDSDLQLDSSSNVALPDGLEHSTAKTESTLTLDSQLEQNLKSDPDLENQDTVDKSDSIRPEFLSMMDGDDGNKDPKRNANVTQCIPENKEEEFAEIDKISENNLQPFTLADEKVPSPLPDLFVAFTNAKAEGLDDEMKRDNYPETDVESSTLPKTTLPERNPEIAPSELAVEETELVFASPQIKMDDPLLEMPASDCSDNILAEGTSNSEDKKTDTSLSAIPESVLHTHAEGTQKRWKSPGEKKMIPNVPQPVVQDNSNVAEKSIDDILNESDDITKSILEQMEEFNRSLMCMSTEKENVTTNKQDIDKELDFVVDKSILATDTSAQVNEEVEDTTNQSVAGNEPLEKSIESDASHEKRAKSEPREDQETTCVTTEELKVEVKEEIPKGDEVDVKNIDVKFPIESVELKKEAADLESSSSSSKTKDIKPEAVEKEVDVAKSKHKESSKERSRSNSKEKQHHRSGSKSKGRHQESHKSSKKQTQDGGSSYRKIKTPAEKKETMNLKTLKVIAAASTQTDFTEQPKKGKREVSKNLAAISTQTDVLQPKKAKVISTQTDFSEPSKKANIMSTQTDFPEPPQIKKVKTYTLSTQTDLVEPAQSKKVKSYTLSTQTDSVEPIHSKKAKPKETKSVQTTDFCDPKKGKPEKVKSKNSGTQSEATRTHSREIQATSSFKSIEIQTDPFKMSFSNETVDINLNTEGITGKMMLRKYAVRKLKDIGAQIEHLMKLQQSFYELMLESDDESETLNAPQSTAPLDGPKVEPEKKDLDIKLEDVKQVKPESEGKSAPKSRKRKAVVSNEDKRSKRLKHSDEAETTAAIEPPIEEVDTNASLENANAINKKDRRKRRIEDERNAAETRGPLNIKISLKNLKASPYRNEEEIVTKQKPRRGRDSKAREKSVKIKEEKEGRRASSIDTVINEVISEEVHVKEEIPEVNIIQETPPDIHVEDPDVHSEPEEQKTILKIKLPLKRFRSRKANSEAKELVDDVNLMMSKYSREIGKIPRGTDTRSKRKSDRRSKQTASNNVRGDLDEVQKHGYDKRFFLCNVSLRRYNLQELNQLKGTIHSDVEQILSDTPNVNVDDLSAPKLDVASESPVKSESEPPPTAPSDKTSFDMSPISLQMLDELKQVVESVPETSDFAVTSDTVTTDDQEIEFNTFNSALLILKVINSVMLAGSETGKLYYYNIENGEVLHAMNLSKKPLTCICVNKHEDKSNVYVGSLNGKISVFDFETKHVANTIKLDEGVQCMELSWDYLFVGTHKGQLVRYDLKKEKVDDSIKIYDTSVLAVKATQEGARRVLLLATRNELVSVRDAMTGLLMRTMESSFYPTVYTILLNNNFVYCGTSHHDILVYTFQDGQLACTHEASNSKGVACLKIVGNLLFAGCYNGNVYVYNTTTNDYLGQIVGPGMILSLEVLEDKIFLGTKNNKLKSLRIPKNFLDQL